MAAKVVPKTVYGIVKPVLATGSGNKLALEEMKEAGKGKVT